MQKISVLNIHQFHDHDSAEDFYANTLEDHLVTRHKDISLPHSHNFYLAILFTHGSGLHEVDFSSYDVKPGALFFLNPGQTHHWELSSDTKGYIFFHTRSFFELQYAQIMLSHFPFYYSVHNNPSLYLDNDEITKMAGLFRLIYTENHSNLILKTLALANLVSLIYINSTRLYASQNPAVIKEGNLYYSKFRKFEELIEDEFKKEKSPAAYASKMAMTSKHLNRITQAVIGKTATDVILDRVLLEAKKEMVLQKGSLNQIAGDLGYDDYAYFSRLFKARTGETPSKFLIRYGKE
jgi:AraC family transcriptional activator of pobA